MRGKSPEVFPGKGLPGCHVLSSGGCPSLLSSLRTTPARQVNLPCTVAEDQMVRWLLMSCVQLFGKILIVSIRIFQFLNLSASVGREERKFTHSTNIYHVCTVCQVLLRYLGYMVNKTDPQIPTSIKLLFQWERDAINKNIR